MCVGIYWLQGKRDIADVGFISGLFVYDWNFRLRFHGYSEPRIYITRVYNVTETEFKGYRAFTMYVEITTRDNVEPYGEVKLMGFFAAFYDEKSDRTAIVYAMATREKYTEMKRDCSI